MARIRLRGGGLGYGAEVCGPEPGREARARVEPSSAPGVVQDDADAGLWWERERFRSVDSEGVCPAVIDVTGKPRCLVYGPHLILEPGLWRATAIFELCPDAARRRLVVQFGPYPDYATEEVPMGRSGTHKIDLDYEFQTSRHAEVRMFLMRAGFHGELRFSGAVLRKVREL